jgi:hypothetical protein
VRGRKREKYIERKKKIWREREIHGEKERERGEREMERERQSYMEGADLAIFFGRLNRKAFLIFIQKVKSQIIHPSSSLTVGDGGYQNRFRTVQLATCKDNSLHTCTLFLKLVPNFAQ